MKIKYEISEEEKNHLVYLLGIFRMTHKSKFMRGEQTIVWTGQLNTALKTFDMEELNEEDMKKVRDNDVLYTTDETEAKK